MSDLGFALTVIVAVYALNTLIIGVPLGYSFWLSLHDTNAILRTEEFVGADLYGEVLSDPAVIDAIWRSLGFVAMCVAGSFAAALGIALVLRYVAEIKEESAPRLDWLGFLLSAVCLATLVSGFEAIGRDVMPLPMLLGMIAVGAACGFLYAWHARRVEHPIIDLSLMRIPTFAISTLGGNLCRFAVGATPFLLAMLLQVGFGLSPFSAGLITFASAAGALLMKFVATPIVRHFGFRRVLTVNALLTGVFIMVCATFTPATPVWLMIAILLVGGFFRSLQ
ncbi:hypothetical protein G6F22_009408 [Rhizopus arrhizus]|nr:hypothetical protein G6F22_009408 [Rhizopus arrhizus]